MLTITLGGMEYFDEAESRFLTKPGKKVTLEHSLKSVAHWESKWKKPFISSDKTREESIDYLRCMEVTGQMDPSVFQNATQKQIEKVNEYINDKMTATTITHRGPKKPSREIITAEIIYYWMIQAGIPPEYEKWHLNRLLMLIEVCSAKSGPQQKMSKRDQMAQQRALNASRKAKLHSKG